MMKRQKLENIVIFVARKYGGFKLGADCINCYVEAALNAVQKLGHQVNLEIEDKVKKTVERRLNISYEQLTAHQTQQELNELGQDDKPLPQRKKQYGKYAPRGAARNLNPRFSNPPVPQYQPRMQSNGTYMPSGVHAAPSPIRTPGVQQSNIRTSPPSTQFQLQQRFGHPTMINPRLSSHPPRMNSTGMNSQAVHRPHSPIHQPRPFYQTYAKMMEAGAFNPPDYRFANPDTVLK